MRGVDVHLAEVKVGYVYVAGEERQESHAHDEFVGSGNGVDAVVQRVVGLRSEKPLHA